MIGKVESIKYTTGGMFGNQWTTIDGVSYMTWWDALRLPIRIGAIVEYEAEERTISRGNISTTANCAEITRVVE